MGLKPYTEEELRLCRAIKSVDDSIAALKKTRRDLVARLPRRPRQKVKGYINLPDGRRLYYDYNPPPGIPRDG